MNQFVVIGGVPRSGTNLARRIIGSHSRIAIPPAEFQFFAKHKRGKSIEEICANKRLIEWGVNLSDLYALHPRDAYIMALQRYTKRIGKEIPGEKTPSNEFYFETIETWLKDFDLRFVHMIRNPFDTIASFKYAPFRGDGGGKAFFGVAAYARNWCRSVSFGLARAYFSSDKYLILKYEDLTTDPVSKTKELSEFIGVEFEEERMLTLSDFAGHHDNTSFPYDRGEKSKEYQAVRQPRNRKHYLTASEVKSVSIICGELAWALGYDDEDFGPSLPEGTGAGFKRRLKQTIMRFVTT